MNTPSVGNIKTPIGDAPILPLIAVGIGGYLLWFGVHYWRGTGAAEWPSYPVKSVLQGKGEPAPEPAASTTATLTAYETQLAGAYGGTSGGGGSGVLGQEIANDAEAHIGARYVWGGATPNGWDCSGMCNWIIGHDMRLDIPGVPRGQVFNGSSHGPDVASWLAWSGVQHVETHQPGDLVCWGPNAHMGIVVSGTECVSAQDPALGTRKTPIATTHTGAPTFLRLRAVTHAGGQTGGNASQNKKLGMLLAGMFGWSPSQSSEQWQALDAIWTEESGWRTDAQNPSSGAYGIPQALPGNKMRSAGADWHSNPRTQILWGLRYIKQRYGTPKKALEFHKANGWY